MSNAGGPLVNYQKSQIGDKSAAAVSHEEWMRRKKHEE